MGGWVGGWVSGGGGHLSVCGYAKILGGWVPELTPPPRVGKQNPAKPTGGCALKGVATAVSPSVHAPASTGETSSLA